MYSCPRCSISLEREERGHTCRRCGFMVPYVFRGHRLTPEEIDRLLTRGRSGKADHWSTKDGGRKLRGELIISDAFQIQFVAERITYALCPRCSGKLYHFSHGIMCSGCDFTFFRKFAGRKLTDREMMQVLLYRKSEKLERFVSKETGKYFSAYLIIDQAGDIALEF